MDAEEVKQHNSRILRQWVGDPWAPAIVKAHADLQEAFPGYRIDQIKEKFGGLRFYFSLPTNDKDTEQERREKVRAALNITYRAETWVWGFEAARAMYEQKETA